MDSTRPLAYALTFDIREFESTEMKNQQILMMISLSKIGTLGIYYNIVNGLIINL